MGNSFKILVLALLLFASANAYTSYIRAPAVLVDADSGILTHVSLNVTAGTGSIIVTGPGIVGSSTTDSAVTAVGFAANYLGINESKYNFKYRIDNSSNVSGPSAGLAFTLLAISALQQKPLSDNFTVTGTISPNGTVGEIGGVYDKVEAAKLQGMDFVLVPYAPPQSFESEFYYIAQQHFNIPLIEVANVSQALPYAFGDKNASRLSLNISTNYDVGNLSYANISCIDCNNSAFEILANYTINATYQLVSGLSDNYTSVKQQMLNQLAQYKQLEAKGYLYSASDLSYLEYINAFMFASSNNATSPYAAKVMQNLTTYCESLTPPPLTTLNYEYVVGGEMRQSWGIINLNYSEQLLNQSQSSDDVLDSLDVAASSAGWCNAAKQLYSIGASMGGNYVNTSSSVVSLANSYINDPDISSGMYKQAAIQNYDEGRYAASLYSGIYANTFDNTSRQYNGSGVSANSIRIAIKNDTYGVWPSQFAKQTEFYLGEANLSTNKTEASGYVYSAYTTMMLSAGLNYANMQITNSFVYSSTPVYTPTPVYTTNSSGVGAINKIFGIGPYTLTTGQIHIIYIIVIIALFVALALIILLIAHLSKPVKESSKTVTTRRRSSKKRRK